VSAAFLLLERVNLSAIMIGNRYINVLTLLTIQCMMALFIN